MPVTVILRKEKHEVSAPTTVGEALAQLGLSPEMYLVLREGILIDEHELLAEGETVQLIGVISGGGPTPTTWH
jgi:sulfur carrier protein ThiS